MQISGGGRNVSGGTNFSAGLERTSDFSIAASDLDTIVPVNGASNNTVITATVDPEATTPIAIGSRVRLKRAGNSDVMIAGGTGVSFVGLNAYRYLRTTNSIAELFKIGPNAWEIRGDLKPNAELVGEPDTSAWSVLFVDDSTKPLSFRKGQTQTINGQINGPFTYGSMRQSTARGNWTLFEWTDTWQMSDPYEIGSRRDDQSYAYNMLGGTVKTAGFANIVRDVSAGKTTLRARQKVDVPNAASLAPHATTGRLDGSYLGAMMTLQHALFGPPPFEIIIEGIDDAQGLEEFWTAFWTRQSDTHVSATDWNTEVTFNGAHTEHDLWERTGLLSATNKIWMAHHYQPSGGGALTGTGAYSPDMGGVIGSSLWDARIVNTTEKTYFYFRPNGDPNWTKYDEYTHPVDSRFSMAPIFLHIDAKAGFGAGDNPGWVKSVGPSTPAYDLSWKSITVKTPANNLANWTNDTIDPTTIPAMNVTWSIQPVSWDNSAAVDTILGIFTGNLGYSYEVNGLSGIGFTNNQLKVTGVMPPGTREICVWSRRIADDALFLAGVFEVTVADSVEWWDADAKVHLNFESQQVRLAGVAGVWSDYVDGSGNPTTTMRDMLPGYAATGVIVLKGSSSPSGGYKGLYGYPSADTTGMYAIQWVGNGALAQQAIIKTSDNLDHSASIADTALDSDPFAVGVSWAAAGSKVCGNGGAVTGGSTFAANNGTGAIFWNTGYGDRLYPGNKQQILLFDPEDIGGSAGQLVSDGILQGKAVHL